MIIYIIEQGAILSKKQGKIIVSKNGEKINEIPIKKIDKINIMGNINITTPAINYFLDNNIEVIFMTRYGRYRGKLYKEEYKNVLLRLKQYEKSFDETFKLKMAKSIVKGKLKNYYDFLLKKQKYLLKGEISQEIATIRSIIERTTNAKNIDSVRGYEGMASKAYFNAFKNLIKNKNFKFEKRISHPPKDEINSILSFGYSFLYNELLAAINIVGLDPYFGNLHTVAISKKSLLFDMVEEFRNIIIDDFVLKLINRNEIKINHFSKQKDIIHFTEDGIKIFISKYENLLASKMKYHLDEEENYIRIIFEKQMRHYARVILGDEEEYIPFFRKEID
ncbi:CRISPR-associated endonuclease Cas1 [Tepiditoga spiralis]|uniref:CRISPR-associated endonuclease Cas1 n=1 Tax=Tepiditoga spiralis TaxID=2108365 RepID=A0A7G1G5Q3_9BACT|nr:CRISPR-associated endonuclease Cas1 [Tepiditoga spiralis]BBE31741.1 CRISPR-associated endonuclease Cas1 [Tepiditoga spiralis]